MLNQHLYSMLYLFLIYCMMHTVHVPNVSIKIWIWIWNVTSSSAASASTATTPSSTQCATSDLSPSEPSPSWSLGRGFCLVSFLSSPSHSGFISRMNSWVSEPFIILNTAKCLRILDLLFWSVWYLFISRVLLCCLYITKYCKLHENRNQNSWNIKTAV